jgi:hypothetical protein
MDCNKTIDFFAEAKRLCDSRTGCTADAANKEQCPLFAFCEHPVITRGAEYAKKLIENLQKWSNEHAKKTYKQDFLEKFPEAQRNRDGVPLMCKKRIYGGKCPETECDECWNEPMNDEETKGA